MNYATNLDINVKATCNDYLSNMQSYEILG
jgi:hypothetical protein